MHQISYLEAKGCNAIFVPLSVHLALKYGFERSAIRLALKFGHENVIQLTTLVFYARHPELEARPFVKTEAQFNSLLQEWQEIREKLVEPAVAGHIAGLPHGEW